MDFLLERIIAEGRADGLELKMLLSSRASAGLPVDRVLVAAGVIDEEWLCAALAEEYGLTLVDLTQHVLDPALVSSIPREVLVNYCVLPLERAGSLLTLAMADPGDLLAEDAVQYITGCRIQRVLARRDQILAALQDPTTPRQTQGVEAILDRIPTEGDLEYVETVAEEEEEGNELAAPIVQLVNSIISQAIRFQASDIHFEPLPDRVRVRNRIDGILRNVLELPKRVQNPCVSRFKLIAGIDISERRRPQDGRAQVRSRGRDIDLRVSSLPGFFGEKIVVRILDQGHVKIDLENLGMLPREYENFTQILRASSGMILITGPTGSGKTSTLYSALRLLNSEEVNIVTVEDPVEYQLRGIHQVQTLPKAGVSFASSLRSILRQDPDVVMLGEVRDLETAEIAFQAAQTGHLVLATLHTNDAPSAVTRLLLMGVPIYLLNSSLLGVVAQRLVRKLCPHCRVEGKPTQEQVKLLSLSAEQKYPERGFNPVGCERCDHIGFKGRIGLFEMFVITEPIRELLLQGVGDSMLWKRARAEGMYTLLEDGLKKVSEGATSLSEVLRVVNLKRMPPAYRSDLAPDLLPEPVSLPPILALPGRRQNRPARSSRPSRP
ncbi:MAG: Flp pilus assembly complex ATPase component TadA [Armatimonadetes bacterium]|nr:Flp pilus assembly complex ATPase component TadA [Armatimonadota bacterium]